MLGEQCSVGTLVHTEFLLQCVPEGETETLEIKVVSHGVEGVNVDPNDEGRHERGQVKNSRRQSEAAGEGEEIKSPKRKMIRVESETQDYVREADDTDRKEGEEIRRKTAPCPPSSLTLSSWRTTLPFYVWRCFAISECLRWHTGIPSVVAC